MEYTTVVALDAMGGDNSPEEIVKGAVQALEQRPDIKVHFFGNKTLIEKELEKYQDKVSADQYEITHTSEVIAVDENAAVAIKSKKDSSIVVGMKSVKEGKCHAFISAGSTAAIIIGGNVLIGRCKGVRKSPMAPVVPNDKGVSLVIDCGANTDAKPEYLVSFAKMGSIYSEKMLGVANPTVGLVNIGVEENKGNDQIRETYQLLKACDDINFIGNVEPRDIPSGAADVLVCDAFVGNVIIKLTEGLAGTLMHMIKDSLMSSTKGKIAGLLAKDSLQGLKNKFDASCYGGAPLLGLKGLVVKTHGNSKAGDIMHAIFQCVDFKNAGITEMYENVFAKDQMGGKDE